MRLKCLDIQGFKSFPDKINIGFDAGYGDCWAKRFGEEQCFRCDSLGIGRAIEQKPAQHQNGGRDFFRYFQPETPGICGSRLTIDNGDHALNLDYNEVMITRRYYRSGESEYFINKAPARLRDINELFMDTGIGRDGYSIIGQGTIDQILLGKSEERRSMLEEVAGISKFRYRKNEAQRKLEATEENLIRLGDIVNELRGAVA